MDTDFDKIRSLISERLDTSKSDDPEQVFIDMIAKRVAELMESNMELFINHLYRMDVDERKVNRAFSFESNAHKKTGILEIKK